MTDAELTIRHYRIVDEAVAPHLGLVKRDGHWYGRDPYPQYAFTHKQREANSEPQVYAEVAFPGIALTVYDCWGDGLPKFSRSYAAAFVLFVWLTEVSGEVTVSSDMEEWGKDNPVTATLPIDGHSSLWRPFQLAMCDLVLQVMAAGNVDEVVEAEREAMARTTHDEEA